MKRIVCCLFIILVTSCTFGEKIPSTINEPISLEHPEWKSTLVLGKSFKGNFTNSGYDEYIAFYYLKEETQQPLYDKVIIYIVKGDKIIYKYPIYEMAAFQYNKIALKAIKALEPVLGEWNGYYYQFDFNHNGIPELILFPFSGTGLGVRFYEFRDKQFVSVANTNYHSTMSITLNSKKLSFSLYNGFEYEEHKSGLSKTTFRWNDKNMMYEVVEDTESDTIE